MRGMSVAKIIGISILGILGLAAFGFIIGLVVMLLWNWLMPTIFGLPELSYWQAVGLTILSHILLKGPSFPGRHGSPGDSSKARAFGEKVRQKVGAPHGCWHHEPPAPPEPPTPPETPVSSGSDSDPEKD